MLDCYKLVVVPFVYLTDLVRGFTSTGRCSSPWKAYSKSVLHVLHVD